jgi:alpha-L-rhamnosidase
MSVPTDCDQRDERQGWMADAHLSSEQAIHNYDMAAFYSGWVRLMTDDQMNGSIAGKCTSDWHLIFRYNTPY